MQDGRQRLPPLINSYFLKKLGQPRPLFRLFSVFSNKQYKFYNKSMWKNVMSIQYPAPGFEPTTFGTWVSSPPITTRPGLPPSKRFLGHNNSADERWNVLAFGCCKSADALDIVSERKWESPKSSVTRLGDFWKFLGTKFLAKVAQIFSKKFGCCEKWHFIC